MRNGALAAIASGSGRARRVSDFATIALPIAAGALYLVAPDAMSSDVVWMPFYFAVLVGSWIGSEVAAGTALFESLLLGLWLPTFVNGVPVGPAQERAALVFVVIGLAMIVMQSAYRRGAQRLQQASEMLDGHVSQGLAGMYTNRGDRFCSVNSEFIRMMGYDSADEIIGLSSYDLLVPEEQAHMREISRRRWSGESPVYNETLRARRRDGSELWVELRGRIVKIDGVDTAVGIVLDVTDRVETERALAEEEALFRRASRIGKVAVFQIAIPSLEVTCSDQMWDVIGWEMTAEPLTLERIESILSKEDGPLVRETLRTAVSSCEPWDIEVDSLTQSGEARRLRIAGEPVAEDNVVVRTEGTVSDITESYLQGKAVLENQERFRAIFEQSPEGVFLSDGEGCYVDANQAGLDMLGYTHGELMELNVLDVLPVETRARALTRPEQLGVSVRTFEGELVRKDGSRFVGETLMRVLQNGVVLAIVRDISESHAVTEALRRSEERYRALVEGSPEGIFVADATGTYLEVNEAGCAMMGRTRDQILGAAISDLVAPEELPRLEQRLRRGGDNRATWRFMRPDGSVFVGEVFARQLSDGRLQASVRDVSERERREQQVIEAKQRLELAAEAAGIGVWEMIDGVVTVDARTVAIFGLGATSGVVSQQEIGATIHPDDLIWLRDTDERVSRHGEILSSEYRVIHPDGSIHWVLDFRKAFENPSVSRSHVVGVVLDITDRKRAEAELRELNVSLEKRVALRTAELEETNNELEAFTYAVSHDLRAPLRRMTALSGALEQDYGAGLEDAAKHFMHLITEEATQAGTLIEGLLDLSRASRGVLERGVVDVSSLVESLVSRLRAEYVDFDVESRIEHRLTAFGDRRMLESLLTNLLDNAWKYSRGAANALVEVYAEDADGHHWICVRDFGAGFDPRYEENLFVPFQRLHSEDEFKGVGVGLATVYRIVRRHGGDIRATGDVGKGATFRFWLPEPKDL